MYKYDDIVNRTKEIKTKNKSSYLNYLERYKTTLLLRPDIKNPTPEVEQYMDDPLRLLSKEELLLHRSRLAHKIPQMKQQIIKTIFPVNDFIADYNHINYESCK